MSAEDYACRRDKLLSYYGPVKVVCYGVVGVAVRLALSAAGLNLNTLTFIGGTLGEGIGYGLKNAASNLVSSLLVLFDCLIRPDEVISIGESYDRVAKTLQPGKSGWTGWGVWL